MKFLKVSGNGDYSAMTFMDNFDGDLEALFRDVEECEGSCMTYTPTYEIDDEFYEEEIELEAAILNIDEQAFDYLRDVWADYDASKATDIIPIGEWNA